MTTAKKHHPTPPDSTTPRGSPAAAPAGLFRRVLFLFFLAAALPALTRGNGPARAECAPDGGSGCDERFYSVFGPCTAESFNLGRINLGEACAQGWSGLGVAAGVTDDSLVLLHPEFAGRTGGHTNTGEDSGNDRGMRVAGTIGASREILNNPLYGSGIMGVAYNATLRVYATGFSEEMDNYRAFDYFISQNNVCAINRGWGEDVFLEEFVGPGMMKGKNSKILLLANSTKGSALR